MTLYKFRIFNILDCEYASVASKDTWFSYVTVAEALYTLLQSNPNQLYEVHQISMTKVCVLE